jgi:hypothetical protein
VVVLMMALLGCSSKESASDEVCDARAELRTSLSVAVDDVKAGNLGAARDSATQARTAFDDLTKAAGELKGETAQEVQPEVDQLRANVDQLTDVTSLQQLSTQVQSILDDVGGILGKVSDRLDCS